MQQHARRLAVTSAIIHGLVHASVLMLPPLLGDLQRAYQVSLLEVLAAANAMYLVYGLAAIPAGMLADRFGSRRMLVVAATGCGLALLGTAVAPNFATLAVGLIAVGICAGIYHPSGLSLLSRGVPARETGRAIGIHGAGGNLGEALAPSWATFFAANFDWRIGFLAAGVLSFGCGVLAATLPPEAPSAAPEARSRPLGQTLRTLGVTLVGFWRNRRLRWLLAALIAAGFVFRGFVTFLAIHLSPSAELGATAASYLLSAVLVVGMVAQRWGGALVDRRPQRGGARERLLWLESALLVPVVLAFAFAGGLVGVALALAFMFVWAIAQPAANALCAGYTRPGCHGVLYGVQFAATCAVGSFATTLGGFLLAKGGTRAVFVGLAAVALLGTVAAGAVALRARRPLASGSRGLAPDDAAAASAAPAEPA